MTKNKKIIAGLILIASAIGIMLFASVPSAGGKEISITELVNDGKQYKGEYVVTQGLLAAESVQWNSDEIELEFQIYDENDVRLPVFYPGIKPDNFSEDVIVIVDGIMNEKGVFEAERLQTKCPSKYEGEDMENYDPKAHQKILKDNQE